MEEKFKEVLGDCVDYAHRGCWDRHVPENSKTAVWRAVEKGLGLEIDVHLTKDGGLVIFHDYSLRRMCGVKGIIEETSTDELTKLPLKGNNAETIPTLQDVLQIVDGRVPILLELKCRNNATALAEKLIEVMSGYSGKYMYIGFNEEGAKYFKDRGYTIALSCFKPKTPKLDFKPDALLCNIRGVPKSQSKLKKYPPFISWTVVNDAQRKKSESSCIATIYNTKHFDF